MAQIKTEEKNAVNAGSKNILYEEKCQLLYIKILCVGIQVFLGNIPVWCVATMKD